MPIPVSQHMIDVGYRLLCKKEPMVSNFLDEEDAAPILAGIFKAMFVAGGYDKWSPPPPPPAPTPAKG